MEQNNASRRAEYLQQNKKRNRRKKIVSILACIVVFCTTYALILPAITMAKMTKVLTCPLSVHEHVDSCYDEDGNLICGQADFVVHTHGEDCYDKDGNLVCQLPEIKAHKHTAECYEEVKTLTCPLEENEEHAHTDECYTTEQVLTCDNPAVLHRHTDSCYDEDGNLICGQMEVLEHIHENGCFTEVKKSELPAMDEVKSVDEAAPVEEVEKTELDAVANLVSVPVVRSKAKMMAAGPMKVSEAPNGGAIDMTDMITEVTVDRREAGTSRWLPEDINKVKAKVGDELRFTLYYEVPAETLNNNNYPLTYHVPSAITLQKNESGDVYDSNGRAVGTYTIGTNGQISIQFDDSYAQENVTSPIFGHISFSASVENIGSGGEGTTTVTFKDGIDIPIQVRDTEGDLSVEKKSSNVNVTAGTLDYEIVVSSQNGTLDVVTLTDLMKGVQASGSIIVKDRNGNTVPVISSTVKSDSFQYVLPRMEAGDEYHITYSAMVSNFKESTVNGTNTVSASSTDSLGFPIEAHDSTTDQFTKQVIQKSGTKSADGNTVDWQIVINAAKPRIPLDGWRLSDTSNITTAMISPDPATGSGSTTIPLPYTFPSGSGDRTYTITYQTAGDVTTNTATLTPPGDGESISTTVGVGVGKVGLSKHDTAMYPAGEDTEGNHLVTCEWDVTVDTTTAGIQRKEGETLLGVNNFPYWQLQDSPTAPKEVPHFYTLEQLKDTIDSMEEGIANSGYRGNYYIFATVKGELGKNSGNEIVLLRYSTTPNTKWEKYIQPLSKEITYEYITIVFDSDFQGGVLNFHSYTTLNVGDGAEQYKGRNNIYLKYLDNPQDSTYSEVTYKPVVTKYDASKTSTGGVGVTEHSEKELTLAGYPDYKVLQWGIDISLPAKEYDGDVVITETLPDGIKLLPENVYYGGSSVKDILAAHDGAENLIFYFNHNYDLNDKVHAGFNFTPEVEYSISNGNGQTNISTDSNGICTISNADGRSVWAQKVDDNTYEIHIPYAMVQYLTQNNYPVKIEVNAYIDDNFQWGGFTQSFTNQVTISSGTEELGSTTQTQTVTRNIVTKASTGYNQDTHKIPYSIVLNPTGVDLVEGADRITLIDTMSYAMPADGIVSATLDNDSVRVFRTDGDEDENITSQCHYTISDNLDGASVAHTMTMDLPDSIPLRVEYAYRLRGEGTIQEIKNVAQIEGDSDSASDENSETQVAVEKSAAEAEVVGINVYKVDGTNYAVHLKGAEFTLQKWNGSAWTDVSTCTTDANGMFNTGALDKYTAYRLTETTAPPGYLMKDGAKYDFYIVEIGVPRQVDMPSDFNGKAVYVGANIYIENDAVPYELPETGGMGTAMYYAAGGMLMLAAAVLLVCKKRRNTVR